MSSIRSGAAHPEAGHPPHAVPGSESNAEDARCAGILQGRLDERKLQAAGTPTRRSIASSGASGSTLAHPLTPKPRASGSVTSRSMLRSGSTASSGLRACGARTSAPAW